VGVQVNNKIVHAEEVVGALVEHCGGRSERISRWLRITGRR
jgi:hypothetical protein